MAVEEVIERIVPNDDHLKVTLEDCIIDSSAPFEEIANLMTKRGGIVIKNLLSKEDALKMLDEFQPHIEAHKPADDFKEYFFSPKTVKFGGCLAKSQTYVDKVILNETVQKLAFHVCSRRNLVRFNAKPKWATAEPQINLTAVLQINPGAKAQILHRDDYTLHNMLEQTDVWTKGRDVSILVFVAMSKVTAENGGTQFVPGSHLWGPALPTDDDALKAEMDIGDAFVMLCSTYHGGGANKCAPGSPDSIRSLATVGWSISYLRQEENQYLALEKEEVMKLPLRVQEMAGWAISKPSLGWVDFNSPLKLLGHDIPEDDTLYFDEDQSDHK